MSTLLVVLKTIRQLGFSQASLYTLYKLGLMSGVFKRLERSSLESEQLLRCDLFPLPAREELKRVLGNDSLGELLAEADEIAVKGRVRLFGGDPVPLRLSFDKSLSHWTAYETRKLPIPDFQFPNFDVKFIWEPARFGWAFTLGRAYRLSGDETYAAAFWQYFEQFDASNPPNRGPNWMNGQEVAIRLMALVWAGQVFSGAAASSAARMARLAGAVTEHAARIPPTLLYARAQNNNHLLTEAAGLVTAALVLPEHPHAQKWLRLGEKWLNWCFENQIDETGEYIQHSVNYHRLMLQVALWIVSLRGAERAEEIPNSSGGLLRFARNDKLKSATRWLAALTDPLSGDAPNLGANDGAYIFPMAHGGFRDFRPVVQAASRAFLGEDAYVAGPWDEMPLWCGAGSSKSGQGAGGLIPVNPVLRSTDSWAMLRVAEGNLRLAHADLLHVDLWWRGQNVALDPGTYRYTGEPPWNNPWPATRYHNTVTVNGADQMTRSGRFLYLDWAKARWGFGADLNRREQELHASHDGYRKFGLQHDRTLIQAERRWAVLDHIYASKPGSGRSEPFTARLHWLLPDWEWEIVNREGRLEISLQSPQGTIGLVVQPPAVSNTQISLARAGELISGSGDISPMRGWFSPTYGVKVPALSLAVEVLAAPDVFFESEFIFPG